MGVNLASTCSEKTCRTVRIVFTCSFLTPEYEETLTAEAAYTCPECNKEGVDSIPFKRKKVDKIETLQFTCEHCGAKLNVTKKMKEKKEN